MIPMADQVRAELVLGIPLKLSYPLAAQAEPLTDLFQGLLRASGEAEAVENDVPFAIVQSHHRSVDEMNDFPFIDALFLASGLGIGEQ